MIVSNVKPYLRRNMENPRLHGHDNLCSTIREIYLKSNDEEIRLKCCVAMRMSKNMYNALVVYKQMLLECGVPVGRQGRKQWQWERIGAIKK